MSRLTKKFAIGFISLTSVLFGCSNETSINAKIVDRKEIFGGFARDAPTRGYELIVDIPQYEVIERDTIIINVSNDWGYRFSSDPDHAKYFEYLTTPGKMVRIIIPDSNVTKTKYSLDINKKTVYSKFY